MRWFRRSPPGFLLVGFPLPSAYVRVPLPPLWLGRRGGPKSCCTTILWTLSFTSHEPAPLPVPLKRCAPHSTSWKNKKQKIPILSLPGLLRRCYPTGCWNGGLRLKNYTIRNLCIFVLHRCLGFHFYKNENICTGHFSVTSPLFYHVFPIWTRFFLAVRNFLNRNF